MTLDNHKLFQEIEFDTIRQMLEARCQLPTAKENAKTLGFIRDLHQWQGELNAVKELVLFFNKGFQLTERPSYELLEPLKLLHIENTLWEVAQFKTLLQQIIFIEKTQQFLRPKKNDFPTIEKQVSKLEVLKEVEEEIVKVFDAEGEVKSSASPELKSIRIQIAQKQRECDSHFNRALKKHRASGYLSEMGETYLHNRRVLSVLSENKRKILGQVLGASKTGQLTYIEPQETVGLNNELGMLYHDERSEINKILVALTDLLRPLEHDIRIQQEFLIWLELVLAKVSLAQQMDGVMPIYSKKSEMRLVKAYHPILLLKNKANKVPTVPHQISLDSNTQRIIVISGPNAGGKSIALKTAGLLQVMYQCGLLVPVDTQSEMGRFENVFTDIGDNQSIDDELSTYSYRLTLMKSILQQTSKNHLVLIDEFGTGSDPELGAALAEVFFEELYQTGCKAILTTHYSNIKEKAGKLTSVSNASMMFDNAELKPLYQMQMGVPGSSYTFEVAQKIGFDLALIKRARRKVQEDRLRLDDTLADVQKNKDKLEHLRERMLQMDKETKKSKELLDAKNELLEERYVDLKEAEDKVDTERLLGKQFQKWLRNYPVNEKQAVKWREQITQEVIKEWKKQAKKLDQEKPSLKKAAEEKVVKKKYDKQYPVKVGALVRIVGSATTGRVEEIVKGKAKVVFGNMASRVDVKKLEGVAP